MLYNPYPYTSSLGGNISNIRFYDISAINGINLRDEFDRLLTGENGIQGIGRYVIYRHFSKTQHSQFWNETTQEAIGGPGYLYQDYTVLTFSVLYTVGRQMRQSEQEIEYGRTEVPYTLFFFRYDVPITLDDEIFELPYNDGNPPDLGTLQLPLTDRWKIALPEPHRSDMHGRIEYWGATVTRESTRH